MGGLGVGGEMGAPAGNGQVGGWVRSKSGGKGGPWVGVLVGREVHGLVSRRVCAWVSAG